MAVATRYTTSTISYLEDKQEHLTGSRLGSVDLQPTVATPGKSQTGTRVHTQAGADRDPPPPFAAAHAPDTHPVTGQRH